MKVEAVVLDHFYTTDFFQQSIFHSWPMQVISVYYTISIANPGGLEVLNTPFGYTAKGISEAFRWLPINAGSEAVSLPIDQVVFSLLKEQYRL